MKERIIGAAILVLFVVLVVPVFLDGPPAEGELISQRVLLPGQEGRATTTVILERGRSVPIPAAEGATVIEQAPVLRTETAVPQSNARVDSVPPAIVSELETKEDSVAAILPPAASNASVEDATSVAPATTSATGMWAVQLGSFAVRNNAEKLQATLRKQGYAAFLSQMTKGGRVQYRVRVGPQKNRAGAESTAARLRKASHPVQVVPHP